MTCRPAYNVVVANVVPVRAGFSSISTRRSASCAVISSAACMRYGCTSAQRQMAGIAAVPGCKRMTRSHSGFMLSAASCEENATRARFTGTDDTRSPVVVLPRRAQHGREQIHWHRKDDGGAFVAGDAAQSLEVAQLHRLRLLRQHLGSLQQLFRRLQLAVGVDHLRAARPFRFRLLRD